MASVFFSYSHKDEALRDQLESHLALLKNQGLIDAWYDRRIVAGEEVDEAIFSKLETADIVLLLISSDFISSPYCYSREMKRAMERHEAGEARVIPVILRHCVWRAAPFGKLMAAPLDGKPVTSWPDRDEALADVARQVAGAVEALHLGLSRASAAKHLEIIASTNGKAALATKRTRRSTKPQPNKESAEDDGGLRNQSTPKTANRPRKARAAPSELPPVLHNLPQRPHNHFRGRTQELTQLFELLSASKRHVVISIDGVGGVGKTALALEAASQCVERRGELRAADRFDAIVWTTAKKDRLTADGIVPQHQILHSIEDIYLTIASILGDAELLKRPERYLGAQIAHLLTRQRTLLVVDNLETVDDERVNSFIRDVPDPTKVIVTTRHRIDVAYPIRLSGLPEVEAFALLGDECERHGVSLPVDVRQDLVRRTGGLPLALTWSIGQISAGRSAALVLQRLATPQADVVQFCFKEAIALIREKPAYHALIALGAYGSECTRENLGLLTGLPVLELEESLVLLEKLSLINKRGNVFSTLPLTESYISAQIEGDRPTAIVVARKSLAAFIARARNLLSHTRVLGNPRLISIQEGHIPVLVAPTRRHLFGSEGGLSSPQAVVDGVSLLENGGRVVILGAPGSGKTNLLRYFSLRQYEKETAQVPVLLSLRDLDLSVPLEQSIASELNMGREGLDLVQVRRLLSLGALHLLFDGLDEVSPVAGDVPARISRLSALYPECSYAIAMRTAAVDFLFETFSYVEILPFNELQLQAFAEAWFKDSPMAAQMFAKEISNARNSLLQNVANNPLFASLLCLVFEEGRGFPASAVELLRECLDTLIRRWDSSRSIQRDNSYGKLSGARREQLVAQIAFETLEAGEIVFAESRATTAIERFFKRLPEFNSQYHIDGPSVLQGIEANTGIVREVAFQRYSFHSLVIHHFLVAQHLASSMHLPLRKLAERFARGASWEEVGLMFVSLLEDPTPLVETLMNLMRAILVKDPRAAASLRAAASSAGVPIDGHHAEHWAALSRLLNGEHGRGPKATPSLRQLLTLGRLIAQALDCRAVRDRKAILRVLQEDVLALRPGRA